MILTEYDEEKILKDIAEEHEEIGELRGEAKGRTEGREEGHLENFADLVSGGTITLAKAA